METKGGEFVLNQVEKLSEGYNKLKEEHPTLATNLESIGNFLEVIPVRIGLGAGAKGVKVAVKAGDEIVGAGVKAGAKIGKEAVEKAPVVAKYGVSQATGLAPETIEQILKNPDKFTREAIKAVDRDSLAKTAIKKIEDRINALKDTGKAYTAVRQGASSVDINPTFIRDVLSTKYGLDIVDNKIVPTTKSITRNQNDIKAIQTILDSWGNKTKIDADEFLNLRSDLADLAKYDATKTKASQTVGRGLRAELNSKYRKQISGLENLDKSFAKETAVLKDIKKDYFKKDGNLKDNAISKLANLTGKGKEQALGRLKELIPDIEKQLRILKALEDIKYAGGLKVGTYSRSFAGGLGVATANIPLIVGSILSTPEIAVQLLRKYAKLKGISKGLLDSTIKTIEDGKKLVGKQLQLIKDMINDKSESFKKASKEIIDNNDGFMRTGKSTALDALESDRKRAMEHIEKLKSDGATKQAIKTAEKRYNSILDRINKEK